MASGYQSINMHGIAKKVESPHQGIENTKPLPLDIPMADVLTRDCPAMRNALTVDFATISDEIACLKDTEAKASFCTEYSKIDSFFAGHMVETFQRTPIIVHEIEQDVERFRQALNLVGDDTLPFLLSFQGRTAISTIYTKASYIQLRVHSLLWLLKMMSEGVALLIRVMWLEMTRINGDSIEELEETEIGKYQDLESCRACHEKAQLLANYSSNLAQNATGCSGTDIATILGFRPSTLESLRGFFPAIATLMKASSVRLLRAVVKERFPDWGSIVHVNKPFFSQEPHTLNLQPGDTITLAIDADPFDFVMDQDPLAPVVGDDITRWTFGRHNGVLGVFPIDIISRAKERPAPPQLSYAGWSTTAVQASLDVPWLMLKFRRTTSETEHYLSIHSRLYTTLGS